MNYTENLSLGLPEYGESADVAALNRNSGILDAYVYNTRQMECEPYDSTKTYMSGDLSIHNEVVYECNTDNTTGTWDDSKWDSTTLAEQIAKAKQSGGGQVTKEATGNPIEFTDGADAPLVKCTTAITGSQDLHGYDKPWVVGAGKNKLPLVLADIKALNTSGTWNGDIYTISGVSFTINTDNGGNITSIKATGTPTYNAILHFVYGAFSTSQNMILSGCPSGGGESTYQLDVTGGSTYYQDSGNGVTIPSGLENKTVRIRISIDNGSLGNGVTFYPMLRLSTESDPNFKPYSNICPITAYTEGEISVGDGINKNYTTTGITGHNVKYLVDIISANSFRLYTTSNQTYPATKQSFESLGIEIGKKYTIECDVNITAGTALIGTRLSSNQVEELTNEISSSGHIVFTFTPNSAVNLEFFGSYGTAVTCNLTYYNIVLYEGDPRTKYTTTYPSAIYRGSEDVVNGSATAQKIKWSAKWGDGGSATVLGNYTRKRFSLTNVGVSNDPNAISNIAPMNTSFSTDDLHFYISSDGQYVYIFLPNDTDGNTDIEVAYELATPTTSSVTPTNLPIKSLSGYNHIESSTGDMEVEYISDTYQPLVDLIQSSSHVYSTEEQVVGKWIDGKDLYEKTIVIPNFSASTADSGWYYGTVNLSDYGINPERLFPQQGETYIVLQDTTPRIPIYIDWQGGTSLYLYFLGSRSGTLTVVVRYTKVTVSRSLNTHVTSQKAQIEPLTDKTEEVPTEEEKAVNEEENNDETR